MKKNIVKITIVALGIVMSAGTAMALPTLMSGYNWSDADFYTVTDLTTNPTGTNLFTLTTEIANYESAFGIYTVDDVSNPTSVGTKLEIFSPDREPYTTQTVTFQNNSGNWQVTSDYEGASTVWTPFSSTFGFYYDVQNTGQSYYTAMQLNSVDTTIEHVLTAYNPADQKAAVFLDDQTGGGDRDFNDMTVFVDNVAPIPEPATMILFGTGLIGLAGLSRRKKKS